jgi:hypothetical protein
VLPSKNPATVKINLYAFFFVQALFFNKNKRSFWKKGLTMKKTYLNALIALSALAMFTTHSMADGPTDKVKAIAEEITEMRSTLAKTFVKDNSTITEETFQNVCGAVGKRV